MSSVASIRVEVVIALAERQVLREVLISPGVTVAEAIAKSGVADEFPELVVPSMVVGVWGKVVDRSRPVLEGDRIEIYRPLPVDPRDARRQIAEEGGFMGSREPETDSR